MRVVEVLLHPEGGVFHPIEEAVLASPALARRAIHQFAVHDDDTIVMLYEFEGDVEAARAIFEAHPEVLSFDLTASGRRVLAYIHFRSDGLAARLFRVMSRNEILLDLPLRYEAGNGALRVRAVAHVDRLRGAAAALPRGVRVEVLRIGEYVAGHESLFDSLTERQQAVLRAAIAVGYYDVPRRATLHDVAKEAGLTVPTVGEHLRKTAAHLFKRITPPP